jgi:hypothetical protein
VRPPGDRRVDVVPPADRCTPVVEPAEFAREFACELATGALGAGWSLGTGIVGKRAIGVVTAGITVSTDDGATIDSIVATASVRYGSESASSPRRPNQNSWRREARPP